MELKNVVSDAGIEPARCSINLQIPHAYTKYRTIIRGF